MLSEKELLQIEIKADLFLKKYAKYIKGKPYALDIDAILKKLKFEQATFDKPEHVRGYLLINNDKRQIAVNSNFQENARRFTKGHEIGHYMLEFTKLNLDLKRSPFLSYNTENCGSTKCVEEQSADFFSACIFAPRRKFADKVLEFARNDENRKLFSQSITKFADAIIDFLADTFLIPRSSAIKRCEELKIAVIPQYATR